MNESFFFFLFHSVKHSYKYCLLKIGIEMFHLYDVFQEIQIPREDCQKSQSTPFNIIIFIYQLAAWSQAQDEKGGWLCTGLATHHLKIVLTTEIPTVSSEDKKKWTKRSRKLASS